MAKRIVDESVLCTRTNEYPIRPEHIGVEEHFWDAFGNTETESSALWIIRFTQTADLWRPFTGQQIEDFYRANSKYSNFRFNRLTTDGFIILGQDGKYRVTHEFICQCFKAAPNIGLFAKQKT